MLQCVNETVDTDLGNNVHGKNGHGKNANGKNVHKENMSMVKNVHVSRKNGHGIR